MQTSWFFTPHVGAIVDALNKAYQAERGPSEKAIAFAADYAADKVFAESWVPLLEKAAAE